MAADEWDKDIEITEELPEEEESPALSYEILNYPADTTLRGYFDQWNNGQLQIPAFQRNFVWDQGKASKLIESFLIGLPVPGVFLFKERSRSDFLIIDGQQRITSVVAFQKGTFEEKKFRLKGVAKRWDGKTFDELSEEDRFKIENSVMRATIIQQLDPDDSSSIYQIFERLNTGGVNLNPMEVRKCVSYGVFIDFLDRLNAADVWRQCIDKPKVDRRLRDVELILRCLAIYQNRESYEKPMKGFLNKYAEKMRKSEDSFEAIGALFLNALKRIQSEIGEKPFHLRNRLNYGVVDSLVVSLMTFPDAKNLLGKFESLKADEIYIKNITYNTSDASVLNERIDAALAVFGG